MRTIMKRAVLFLLVFAAGGMLFGNGGNAGCARLGGDTLLGAVNFCFVFDCTSGVLGGAIEPCGLFPVFTDCEF